MRAFLFTTPSLMAAIYRSFSGNIHEAIFYSTIKIVEIPPSIRLTTSATAYDTNALWYIYPYVYSNAIWRKADNASHPYMGLRTKLFKASTLLVHLH